MFVIKCHDNERGFILKSYGIELTFESRETAEAYWQKRVEGVPKHFAHTIVEVKS